MRCYDHVKEEKMTHPRIGIWERAVIALHTINELEVNEFVPSMQHPPNP